MLGESDEGTELRWFSSSEILDCNKILENTREKCLKAIKIMNEEINKNLR